MRGKSRIPDFNFETVSEENKLFVSPRKKFPNFHDVTPYDSYGRIHITINISYNIICFKIGINLPSPISRVHFFH